MGSSTAATVLGWGLHRDRFGSLARDEGMECWMVESGEVVVHEPGGERRRTRVGRDSH